jgi:hypothetical protein
VKLDEAVETVREMLDQKHLVVPRLLPRERDALRTMLDELKRQINTNASWTQWSEGVHAIATKALAEIERLQAEAGELNRQLDDWRYGAQGRK